MTRNEALTKLARLELLKQQIREIQDAHLKKHAALFKKYHKLRDRIIAELCSGPETKGMVNGTDPDGT